MLGIRTQGSRMEGVNKSTELQRHPNATFFQQLIQRKRQIWNSKYSICWKFVKWKNYIQT